jgi:hypothetical protein
MKFAFFLFVASIAFAARLETTRMTPSAGLWFEPNAGQVAGRTQFVCRTRGAYLYMTGWEVMFVMRSAKLRQGRMFFAGAATNPSSRPEQAKGGYSDYFVGNTEKEWFTGVDRSANSPANSAAKGTIVVLYGTGGGVASLPAKVFIDGMECEVLYAGSAPGLVAGLIQVNVRVPQEASLGGLVVQVAGFDSQEGVFIAIHD